jgi:hypothetical protein
MISGTDPRRQAITGVPQAMASIINSAQCVQDEAALAASILLIWSGRVGKAIVRLDRLIDKS